MFCYVMIYYVRYVSKRVKIESTVFDLIYH